MNTSSGLRNKNNIFETLNFLIKLALAHKLSILCSRKVFRLQSASGLFNCLTAIIALVSNLVTSFPW